MITVLLEVKSNSPYRPTNEFYNPAPDEYRKYPRTENGIKKALENMIKLVNKKDWIIDYRIKVYSGKYEYWKNEMQPLFIVDSAGVVTEV